MNVGSCHPHMYGFMWGYVERLRAGKQKPAQKALKCCSLAGLNVVLLDAYIKPSSFARLTAARRLLTLSFL